MSLSPTPDAFTLTNPIENAIVGGNLRGVSTVARFARKTIIPKRLKRLPNAARFGQRE
jgi:hypothetical protein